MIPYEDHFQLTEHDLRAALEISLSRGGDFADVFLEYRVYSFINMEEDIIKETAESVSLGMGIRVNAGEKTGYAYTNDLSPQEIKKAALSAAAVATSGKPIKPCLLETVPVTSDAYPLLDPAHLAGLERKISLVKEAYLACQRFDPRIKKSKASLQDHVQHMLIANSEGLLVRDARPLVKLVVTAIAEKGKRREYGYAGGGGRTGLEVFGDGEEARSLGREAAREALGLLDAVEAPAGEMPVVLAPGHSGVLVHEAVGHLLEADFNRKKTSIFHDKMGKKVGSALVSIVDDPTIPSFRGTYNVDDEGTPPRKTRLIDRGVVASMLTDRLSARLMGRDRTGHGRRQDFSCIPIPRMANTYVEAGQDAPEDILRSVQKGVYAERYEGGQVEDSGKFTFSVSSGHLIEAGRLTAAIKQATLIGSNIDILQNIEMVGSDLRFGLQTGTCSKEGQDVPVTDGCPTLKISRITVGGQS